MPDARQTMSARGRLGMYLAAMHWPSPAAMTAGLIALSVSAACPLPVTSAWAQSDGTGADEYAPARWVNSTTADGARCRAVQSVELGRLACVSEARDALRTADRDIYSHGFFTREDLAVLARGASMGIEASASHICDISQHPDAVGDPAQWRAQCDASRSAANAAAPLLAAELHQETRNIASNEQGRSNDTVAAAQRQQDAAQTAVAREDAAYARDMAAFRASYATGKHVGDYVCVEGVGAGVVTQEGLMDRVGQVERVAGQMIQVRESSPGTPGTDIETQNGFFTEHHYIPGAPGADHLEWKNAREVGLCRLVTPAIQRHECARMSQAIANLTPLAGMFGLDLCSGVTSRP